MNDINKLTKLNSYVITDKSATPPLSTKASLESLAHIYSGVISSTTISAGDFKPVCYPHNWDDEDLLF